MAVEVRQETSPRTPLSRERILTAAVAVADEGGIEALTMRGLAEALDVEAMSLYYHVANKEVLLDGVAEVVVQEVLSEIADLPPATGPEDWKQAMRSRILRARDVMLRHKWAPLVLETRTTMNPAVLRYYHGLLEIFQAGGMSWDLAHHAMHALGSRALGFSQELFDPAPGTDDEEMSEELLALMAAELPLFVEFMRAIAHEDPEDQTLGWCDDQTEFEFALDLMLDGLDRLRPDH
ncbi:MAG TPA: TetR/AcrR family transcriptional regulator C-terminal domain-containing protein [Acidimicrobiia bacterium]|nr:TetR/AcrR family transcriptional regulator C-terminal domain-containing protein [Acidimicrobiia bacterium]